MTHQLIASPYPEGHLVVRPGYDGAVRIGAARYAELCDAPPGTPVPAWLAEAVRAGWGTDITGRPIGGTILARPGTAPSGDGRRRGSLAPAHGRRAADRPVVRRDPHPCVGHGDDDPDLV